MASAVSSVRAKVRGALLRLQMRWSFDEAHPALAEQHYLRSAAQDEALQQARASACSHARLARTYAQDVLRASAPAAAPRRGRATSECGACAEETSARRAAQGARASIARAEELSKSFAIRMRESPLREQQRRHSCGPPAAHERRRASEATELACESAAGAACAWERGGRASPGVARRDVTVDERLSAGGGLLRRSGRASAPGSQSGSASVSASPQAHVAHRQVSLSPAGDTSSEENSGARGGLDQSEDVALGGFSESRYGAYNAELDAEMAARRAAGEAAGDVDAGVDSLGSGVQAPLVLRSSDSARSPLAQRVPQPRCMFVQATGRTSAGTSWRGGRQRPPRRLRSCAAAIILRRRARRRRRCRRTTCGWNTTARLQQRGAQLRPKRGHCYCERPLRTEMALYVS